jgi:hypothetical protein
VAYDPEAAARFLAKLRRFATEDLDSDERVLLGVTLAPAVLEASQSEEVDGFTFTRVGDHALIEVLHAALLRSSLRIVDFREDEGESEDDRSR